jgi:hypothetical protein
MVVAADVMIDLAAHSICSLYAWRGCRHLWFASDAAYSSNGFEHVVAANSVERQILRVQLCPLPAEFVDISKLPLNICMRRASTSVSEPAQHPANISPPARGWFVSSVVWLRCRTRVPAPGAVFTVSDGARMHATHIIAFTFDGGAPKY